MVKGSGNEVLKYVLFFCNVLFVLVGIFIFGPGLYYLLQNNALKDITNTSDIALVLLTIAGFLIFFVSFLGCCGAVRESDFLLTTYSIVVGGLAFLQFAAVIGLLLYSSTLTSRVREHVEDTMKQYNKADPNDPKTTVVDLLQYNMGCCGFMNGPQDWTPMFRDQRLPSSCCFDPLKVNKTREDCRIGGTIKPFEVPCSQAISEFFRDYIGVISAGMIGIAASQLFAACFACILSNAAV